jgi:hypothetical protein
MLDTTLEAADELITMIAFGLNIDRRRGRVELGRNIQIKNKGLAVVRVRRIIIEDGIRTSQTPSIIATEVYIGILRRWVTGIDSIAGTGCINEGQIAWQRTGTRYGKSVISPFEKARHIAVRESAIVD